MNRLKQFLQAQSGCLENINLNKVYYRNWVDNGEVCITIKDKDYLEELFGVYNFLVSEIRKLNIEASIIPAEEWVCNENWGWKEMCL